MKSETLMKAVEKATFGLGMNEITIECDGVTGIINLVSSFDTAMVVSTFPMEIEGSFPISDPSKLVTCLKKINGEVKVGVKNGSMTLRGGSKSYKIPLVQSTRKSPYTPRLSGSKIYLYEDGVSPNVENPALFTLIDVKQFKKAVASEKVYEEDCIIRCTPKGMFTIAGKDDTDFKAADHLDVELHEELSEAVTAKYDDFKDLVKVLGTEHVTISLGEDSLLAVEDIDGDVKTVFVLAPKRR